MFEDAVLTRVTIERALAALPPLERDVIRMVFAYDQPVDYTGPWPPTLAQIGVYVGVRHRGKPMSEGRVGKLRDAVLVRWRDGVGI